MKPRENYLELEEEGLQVPLPSAGESFGCRRNPSQGPKRRKMPLLHIGRFLGNEAKRESPWAPMCWRILSAVVCILPRDTTKEDCLHSLWTCFRVSAPKKRDNLIQKVQRVELKNPLQELPRITVERFLSRSGISVQ